MLTSHTLYRLSFGHQKNIHNVPWWKIGLEKHGGSNRTATPTATATSRPKEISYVERQLQRLLQVTLLQSKLLMESNNTSNGKSSTTEENMDNMKQEEQSLHEMATKLQQYAPYCPNPHGLLHG